MSKAEIGIIGGSGLYKMEGLKDLEKIGISTPFGDPSDKYSIADLGGKTIAFLPRHGSGHSVCPSKLNYRANIYGFKKLGVTKIISVSAVGSLKEDIAPKDVVVPHQFLDRTTKRVCTFFTDGITAHVPFADPICMELAEVIYKSAQKITPNTHWGGTYLNMEGPQFSTKAESHLYRSWGMDIIGMTNLCEAKLSREAEMCYATLALVTDYDCWHPEHDSVNIDIIISYLTENTQTAQKILKETVQALSSIQNCKCQNALKDAIVTDRKQIPDKTKKDLDIIAGKYL